ncbi:MAG: hypothetical protein VW664_05040, partial [Halieaceae bacterium]
MKLREISPSIQLNLRGAECPLSKLIRHKATNIDACFVRIADIHFFSREGLLCLSRVKQQRVVCAHWSVQ